MTPLPQNKVPDHLHGTRLGTLELGGAAVQKASCEGFAGEKGQCAVPYPLTGPLGRGKG